MVVEPMKESESDIADIAASLFEKIHAETEMHLKSQFAALGVDISDTEEVTKHCITYFNIDDPVGLATYYYKDIPILGVRIASNYMGIEWDIPNLNAEAQTKGEAQDD